VRPPEDGDSDNAKASAGPQPTREQVWADMRRSSQGMRDLQQHLNEINDLDDQAFAEATGGTDRGEAMVLLERLNHLLGELDQLTAELRPGVN
jgi:hypothetical protein